MASAQVNDKGAPRLLVSGFEAFGGASINPTQRLIEALRAERPEIETVLLPVVFEQGFAKLLRAIERVQPDIVLSLGQAGGRDAVELERVAINLMDADIADNSGFHPRERPIHEGEQNALFSTLPLNDMLADLKTAGIPARISNSAGLYVCNDLFYRLQRIATSKGIRQSGFVHVPFLPEQTLEKASMTLEMMKQALEIMIATLSATYVSAKGDRV